MGIALCTLQLSSTASKHWCFYRTFTAPGPIRTAAAACNATSPQGFLLYPRSPLPPFCWQHVHLVSAGNSPDCVSLPDCLSGASSHLQVSLLMLLRAPLPRPLRLSTPPPPPSSTTCSSASGVASASPPSSSRGTSSPSPTCRQQFAEASCPGTTSQCGRAAGALIGCGRRRGSRA